MLGAPATPMRSCVVPEAGLRAPLRRTHRDVNGAWLRAALLDCERPQSGILSQSGLRRREPTFRERTPLRGLWRSRMLSVTLANRAGHALFRLAPVAALAACLAGVAYRDASRSQNAATQREPVAPVEPPSESLSPAVSSEEKLADERPLKVPNGDAPRLSCSQARSIVAEVRRRLPAAPPSVSPSAFAELWTDWFDPHGLWSAAPDSPLSAAVQARADALLAELEAGSVTAPCSVARSLAADSKHWVDGLRAVFEQARVEAPRVHFSARSRPSTSLRSKTTRYRMPW